jgi:hypothetical protein
MKKKRQVAGDAAKEKEAALAVLADKRECQKNVCNDAADWELEARQAEALPAPWWEEVQ